MTCNCSDHREPATRTPVGRRTLIAGGVATGLVTLIGRPSLAGAQEAYATEGFEQDDAADSSRAFLPARPANEVHQNNIMFPVLPDPALGSAQWTDTYGAPRSGGRSHEGQDLMAPKMLKLLACVSGTVVELRHRSTGNSLYLEGDDGYYYCYLHINNDTPGTDDGANRFDQAFAPGLAMGQRVSRGQHLAYVGDSGNAEATGSHCHFEIRLPNAKWYNAAACNAKYSLEAAETPRLGGPVSVAPAPTITKFAQRTADDFLGAVPSLTWLFGNVVRIYNGSVTPTDFIEEQLATGRVQAFTNPIIRLYLAYFGGVPPFSGVNHWEVQCRKGTPLDKASQQMADSGKFRSMWGALSNRDFADRIYRNLREGAAPSTSTLNDHQAQLDGGTTRGKFVRLQCEDASYRRTIANKVRVLTIYHGMVAREPDPYWWSTWAERDRTDKNGLAELIDALRSSSEYAARY